MIVLLTDFGQSEYVVVMKGPLRTTGENKNIVEIVLIEE